MADFIGKRFGKLTVISYSRHKGNRAYWACKCDCGAVKEISSGNLKYTQSCGCVRLETIRTHGLSNSVMYTSWKAMLRRCLKPSNRSWKNYGGRGINVCERWQKSFEAFLEDIGPRPYRADTIDRIDVNGNYEPGNVRWISRKENNRNKQDTIFIEFKGTTKPLVEWCEIFDLPYETIFQRIKYSGWTPADALTIPIAHYDKQDAFTFNGETKTLKEWAKTLNIPYKTLYDRFFRYHMPLEKAFTKPLRTKP